MKTIHIIILMVLVVTMAIVVSTMTNSGTYADFEEAAGQPQRVFSIIGTLDRNSPMGYDAPDNLNRFSFYMIDDNGKKSRVVYQNAKPQDFEKSEKVVVIGNMKGDYFLAQSLLLKCPSKYKDKKPAQFENKKFNSNRKPG